MNEFFLNDYEIRVLEGNDREKVFKSYLNYRSETDKWYKAPIDSCSVVGVNNTPLEIMDLMDKKKLNDQKAVEECAAEMGWLLVYPDGEKYNILPTRYTAYESICQRAGISGRTIKNTVEKKNVTPMSPLRKAAILSEMFSLYSSDAKILVRDGKVGAMRSGQYLPIDAKKAIEAIEAELRKEHPDLGLSKAEVSHEYIYADYDLKDDTQAEAVKASLEMAGLDAKEVKAGFRFATSDVGNSALRVRAISTVDGLNIPLGKAIEIRHDVGAIKKEKKEKDFEYIGDFSSEKVEEAQKDEILDNLIKKIAKLGASFKEAEDRIEELGNIDIHDVAGCFQNIVYATSELPLATAKTIGDELQLEYATGGTAMDVFYAVNDIVARTKNTKEMSISRFIQMSEAAAQTMYYNFVGFDRPYDNTWNK